MGFEVASPYPISSSRRPITHTVCVSSHPQIPSIRSAPLPTRVLDDDLTYNARHQRLSLPLGAVAWMREEQGSTLPRRSYTWASATLALLRQTPPHRTAPARTQRHRERPVCIYAQNTSVNPTSPVHPLPRKPPLHTLSVDAQVPRLAD